MRYERFYRDLLKGFVILPSQLFESCVCVRVCGICVQFAALSPLLVYFYCCLNNFRLNCLWQMGFGFATRGLLWLKDNNRFAFVDNSRSFAKQRGDNCGHVVICLPICLLPSVAGAAPGPNSCRRSRYKQGSISLGNKSEISCSMKTYQQKKFKTIKMICMYLFHY